MWTAGIPEQAIAWEMEPFDENGEWFRKGSRWDSWVIGGRYSGKFCGANAVLVRELIPNKYLVYQEKRLRDIFQKANEDKELCYGVKAGESEADYIKRETQGAWFPASFAFLRERTWHETARLGFFGGLAKTECEIAGNKAKPECKCLVRHKSGAKVVSWNSDDETWQLKFYDRFIRPLSPDTMLVVVDYHV